jgi:aspartate/methionine/tyrosine aminotransferase
MNPVFANLPTSVFERMSARANELGAVNLGQGFPEIDGPIDIRERAARAVVETSNQYPSMLGEAALRQAVAAHYRRHQAVDLDWRSEIVITSGATEALAASLFAMVEPGDEVLAFAPLYDSYEPITRRAGATLKAVRLQPPHWRFTDEMLEAVYTPKTKVVLLNNPLNPAATVCSAEDLAVLARFCVRHDLMVICDEVWEHLVYDGRKHLPLISFDGMRERTVKIGSAGKIFSLTGWKVGFVCAAPRILGAIAKAHQFLIFTTPPNLQRAVAYGLNEGDDYVVSLRAELARSRDRLTAGLRGEGLVTLGSQATYFVCVDLAASGINMDDETFCMRMVDEARVAAIPVSAFYNEDPVRTIVRFCFSKTDATLDEAVRRIGAWRKTGALK